MYLKYISCLSRVYLQHVIRLLWIYPRIMSIDNHSLEIASDCSTRRKNKGDLISPKNCNFPLIYLFIPSLYINRPIHRSTNPSIPPYFSSHGCTSRCSTRSNTPTSTMLQRSGKDCHPLSTPVKINESKSILGLNLSFQVNTDFIYYILYITI